MFENNPISGEESGEGKRIVRLTNGDDDGASRVMLERRVKAILRE